MIEPPKARGESYSGTSRDPKRSAGRALDFHLEPQLKSKWCWAAISTSLAAYYGARPYTQRALAEKVLGAPALDRYAMLDDAIARVDCFSHWSAGRPTFERIAAEIEGGRPVCVSVRWLRGGSHYVVVSGYYHRQSELLVEDSLNGASVHGYGDFPGGYRGGAVWTGTYWTRPPAIVDRPGCPGRHRNHYRQTEEMTG